MTYTVKEIFKTIQGEGALAGRVAVFCRFSGCNLWNGREEDRAGAICKWCDTEFVGGDKYQRAEDLAQIIEATWGLSNHRHRMVVLTGGEPALQFDEELKRELQNRKFYIAIETNGTVPLKANPDWICVSPKAGTYLKQPDADELKVVFPQEGLDPEKVAVWAHTKSIQPMDGPKVAENTLAAIAYCMEHDGWKLSLQQHKIAGIR